MKFNSQGCILHKIIQRISPSQLAVNHIPFILICQYGNLLNSFDVGYCFEVLNSFSRIQAFKLKVDFCFEFKCARAGLLLFLLVSVVIFALKLRVKNKPFRRLNLDSILLYSWLFITCTQNFFQYCLTLITLWLTTA